MDDNLGPIWSAERLRRACILAALGLGIQSAGYLAVLKLGIPAAATEVAIVPALLVAYNFGMYAGSIVALAAYLVNVLLLMHSVPDPESLYWSPALMFGTMANVVLAAITGRVREVGKRLRTEISHRKIAQQQLSDKTEDLAQRLQELHSLYELSNLVDVDKLEIDFVLQDAVEIIAQGLRRPEFASVELAYGEHLYRTRKFTPSAVEFSSEMVVQGQVVGRLRAFYTTKEPGGEAELRFSENEKNLLTAAAIHLSRAIERFEDHKEKAITEARLRQAQKMEALGTLAGGIAHDFNNILQAIMAYAELVTDDLPADTQAREDLEEVLRASRRASHLVQQILTFSRQTAYEPKAVELRNIVQEALSLIRKVTPSMISIAEQFTVEPLEIMADPTQIHQVIVNLCTNARHAMEETGGELILATSRESVKKSRVDRKELPPGEYALLSVSDTGHGMDENTLNRIFDPFFTTKAPGKGTGMGLSTVHGIVKNHKGRLTVTSTVGKGTRFDIYFPLTQTKEQEEESPVSPETGEWTESRILVVDDEPSLAQVMKRSLLKAGYEVDEFTSSAAALEHLSKSPYSFDMLITDYIMPRPTGLELALAARRILPDLPVLICTGHMDVVDQHKLSLLGKYEVVEKPIAPRNLVQVVERMLQKKTKEKFSRTYKMWIS